YILQHHANIPSQVIKVILINVYIIYSNGALLYMIKTIEQADNGCFATTGMPNNGNCFSRFNGKAYIFQYIILIGIGKPYLFKLHFSFQVLIRFKSRRMTFRNEIFIVQNFEYPFTCHHSHLQYIEFICQYTKWSE